MKSGKDHIGECPFHDDSKPSLMVTPHKNLWHCFGCQIGGGPIDWVMKHMGVSFRHAVELLRADPSLAAQGEASRHWAINTVTTASGRGPVGPWSATSRGMVGVM